MASSRKSSRSKARSGNLVERIGARLSAVVPRGAQLVVGLSGGVDSVVLLDCLQRLSRRLRFRLRAVHINHQLSSNSDSWERFCRCHCRARKIPFGSARVMVPSGESVEAAARAVRYAVFSRQQADFIVLAQHQDDQVETMLLQLLRGAGVRGLASMPRVRTAKDVRRKAKGARGGRACPSPAIVRPMLDVTRSEICEYAKARGLEWIEDESNANIDFRRNFLRHEVLPVIARRFPSYRATIARSAGHLAEASDLLDELAQQDGAGSLAGGTLAVAALRRLSPARARNLLRYFLAQLGVAMPNSDRLDEALRQVLTAREDARVAVGLGRTTLRRYLGRLYLVADRPSLPRSFVRAWRGERSLALPELGGIFCMERARGNGISLARLGRLPVTLRVRQGGERLQPASDRPRRSLKNLLQEAAVPPWQREHLPLLYCGKRLVWVPEIGIACDFRARRGEASVRPRWRWGGEGS